MDSININDIVNGLLCKQEDLIIYCASYLSEQSVDESFVRDIRTQKDVHKALVTALANKSERIIVTVLAALINCTNDDVFAIQFIRNTKVANTLINLIKSKNAQIKEYATFLLSNLCATTESLNLSVDNIRYLMDNSPQDQNICSILITSAQHADQALKIWDLITQDFRNKFTAQTQKSYFKLVRNIAFHPLEAAESVQYEILRKDLWAQTSEDLFYHDIEKDSLPAELHVPPQPVVDDIEAATMLLETVYLLCRKNRQMREVLRSMCFYPLIREVDRHYQQQELYDLAEEISNFLCGDEEKPVVEVQDSIDE